MQEAEEEVEAGVDPKMVVVDLGMLNMAYKASHGVEERPVVRHKKDEVGKQVDTEIVDKDAAGEEEASGQEREDNADVNWHGLVGVANGKQLDLPHPKVLLLAVPMLVVAPTEGSVAANSVGWDSMGCLQPTSHQAAWLVYG